MSTEFLKKEESGDPEPQSERPGSKGEIEREGHLVPHGAPLEDMDLRPLQLVVEGAEVSRQSVEELKLEKRLFLERVKKLLSGPVHFEPFKFTYLDGSFAFAQNAGLEGFLYTLWDIERWGGKGVLVAQLPYFFGYISALFHEAGFHEEAELFHSMEWNSAPSDPEKYEILKSKLESHLSEAQAILQEQDTARWIRHGTVYQMLLRAFNLAERRAILGEDPENVSGKMFDDLRPSDLPGPCEVVRWTGTYPIGLFNAKGNGGGSPFSVKAFAEIDPQHGGAMSCRMKVDELRAAGIESIFELLLNHSAVDSDLLEKDPTLYIHVRQQPWDTRGYYDYTHPRTGERYWIRRGGYLYDGVRFYWDDTLQLDISNPNTRQMLTEVVKELIGMYGVYGFRVDMAYQLLHDQFRYNWGAEMQYPLSDKFEDEFLVGLIREVKAEYPKAAFIAEGFYGWEKLSAAGFDLMYGQNDMILPGGFRHVGWYEAMKNRDSWTMTEAIKRAAFLYWQRGGCGMFSFVGHHDLPAPQRIFGEWLWGATFLTLLLPMTHNWYAGTEAGFEDPCDENGKMITFNKRTVVRWRGLHFGFSRFVSGCLEAAAQIKREFGRLEMAPLWAQDGSRWVGFLLKPSGEPLSGRKALVLANPGEEPLDVWVHRPDLGVTEFHTRLEKAGIAGQQLWFIGADNSRTRSTIFPDT